MNYSRENPSPRYRELMALYRSMHTEGEKARGRAAEETYNGISLFPHFARIRELIAETGATNLLDYGSGKGMAYVLSPIAVPGVGKVDSLIDYWDVDHVHCYDPCYPPYSRLPEEQFDGVITTDVLEHCPADDIEWIIAELFRYARRFVFASIACYPATAHLPNGENAHCTLESPEWWRDAFAREAARHPGVRWCISTQALVTDGGQRRLAEAVFGGEGRG